MRSIGQAQAVRELSHSLTAVLAREADSRGLGGEEGLSRADWLRLQVGAGLADHGGAGGLDGPAAAALARVGAAMNESRWAALAARVAASEVPVGHAAAIIRFHDDVARIADPDHLDAIVASMVEASDVLTARELGRLIAHARATLKPPSERESEEAGLRLGRSFRKVRSCAGFTVFELRLDPEGAAIVEAAIDRLSRPRPDLATDISTGTSSDTSSALAAPRPTPRPHARPSRRPTPRPVASSDASSGIAAGSNRATRRAGERVPDLGRVVVPTPTAAALQRPPRRIRAPRPRAEPTPCSRSSAAGSPHPRASPAPRVPPW